MKVSCKGSPWKVHSQHPEGHSELSTSKKKRHSNDWLYLGQFWQVGGVSEVVVSWLWASKCNAFDVVVIRVVALTRN